MNYIFIIISFIFGFTIGFFVFWQIRKRNIKKNIVEDLNENKEKYKSSEEDKKQLNIEKTELEAKIIELNKEIKSLTHRQSEFALNPKDLKSVNSISNIQKNPTSTQEEENDEHPQIVDFEIKKPEPLFLSSPFEDNRFSKEDEKKEQTPTSLYKILLDSSNIQGRLELLEDVDFSRALNSPERYFELACSYENLPTQNTKKAIMIESGAVKLDDADWLVTEKIKIKFI